MKNPLISLKTYILEILFITHEQMIFFPLIKSYLQAPP